MADVSAYITAQRQNAQMRAAYIAASQFFRVNQTNSTNITQTQQNYQMPLQSQGLLTSVDLEFSLTIANSGATAALLNYGAPYSFISQISFVDQGSQKRSQISGLSLFRLLNQTINRNFPWGGEGVQNNGQYVTDFSYPVLPLSVPAASGATPGTATYTFRISLPVSVSRMDTTGAVLLQTSQNATAANVLFTLQQLSGAATSPFTGGTLSIQSGTVKMRQNYWQPFGNAVAPPLDIQTINYLWESSPDFTNLVSGTVKEIPLQIQYPTDLVGFTYYNGSSFEYGSDMASVEEWIGNTTINNATPTQRYLDYRLTNGFDDLPGNYMFDYRLKPLSNQMLGTYTIRFQPNSAIAGQAWFSTWYRQSRPINPVQPQLLQAV